MERKKYGHVQLLERFGEAQLPLIETVDLKEAHKRKSMQGLFSPTLFEAMQQTLAEGKQIILFQNRGVRSFTRMSQLRTYSTMHKL